MLLFLTLRYGRSIAEVDPAESAAERANVNLQGLLRQRRSVRAAAAI